MAGSVALLVSGASGMALPRTLLAALVDHPDIEQVHLVTSSAAALVMGHELDDGSRAGSSGGADALVAAATSHHQIATDKVASKIVVHKDTRLDAPIASGSYRLSGTIILPCSAATAGTLATGTGKTLIHRAGAVALKEGWPLILGYRETPISAIQTDNLRKLAWAGAVIHPPIPAFYLVDPSKESGQMQTFLDHYAMRVMDRLGLETEGRGLRWQAD